MSEMDVDWNDLQLFVAVAREGGLSAAVKATQRSAATLGRRMHILEQGVGKELFVRHDRGYELTAEGQTLLAELTTVSTSIQRITAPPVTDTCPRVKISAGTWTTLFLIHSFDALAGMPQDVRVRFVSSENVLDIAHREVVIGIRNRRPTEDALVCRRLARVEFAPYSTQDRPPVWIKVLAHTPSAQWLNKNVGDDAVCEVNAPRSSLDLALAGKGMALLPTFIGDNYSQLQRCGRVVDELSHDRWLVTHQDDRKRPEVRRVIDRISQVLQ